MSRKPTNRGARNAAFIYSLLTPSLRTGLLNRLNPRETALLNHGLEEIPFLNHKQKLSILYSFIREMRAREADRQRLLDLSLALSLLLTTLVMGALAFYARSRIPHLDGILTFLESFLVNGGAHLLLAPLLWGFLQAEYGRSPLLLLFESRQPRQDLLLSLPAGLFLGLALAALNGPGDPRSLPSPLLFTYFLSGAIVGPALEELFFRHFLFLRQGEKHGYLVSGVFSTLLFTLVHATASPLFLAGYMLSGAMLCLICYLRGSLLPCFVIHAVANLTILLF